MPISIWHFIVDYKTLHNDALTWSDNGPGQLHCIITMNSKTRHSPSTNRYWFQPFLFGLLFGLSLWFQGGAMAENTILEVIELNNRPAAEIQELLQPMLEPGDVISSNGFSLIVKSNPTQLENIRKLVEQLDTRLQNLTISVLQSSHKTAEQLNAEAAIAISPPAYRMQGMAGDTRDLDRQQAIQQLSTLEGQPAHIQVGKIRPIENITIYDSGYGYPGISSTTQMQEASTGFAAIPRLIGNGEVMIDIAPWSDRFLTSGGLETQSIQTSIRARLGEWVEIGGSGISDESDSRGMTGMNYSTRNQDMRILIKVDRAN